MKNTKVAGNVFTSPTGAQVALPLIEVKGKLKDGTEGIVGYKTRPIRNLGTPATRSCVLAGATAADNQRGPDEL